MALSAEEKDSINQVRHMEGIAFLGGKEDGKFTIHYVDHQVFVRHLDGQEITSQGKG